MNVKGVQNIS